MNLLCALMLVVLVGCGAGEPANGVAATPTSPRRAPEVRARAREHAFYCPEILANFRRLPCEPGEDPTPVATATTIPTPTPRLLLTRTPSAGIPPEDIIAIIDAVRQGRDLEPNADVHDDPLLAIAGNAMYGAQLQPIIEVQGYRVLETANALVVETPQGEIWILRGYVWARHPLPWLTPAAVESGPRSPR